MALGLSLASAMWARFSIRMEILLQVTNRIAPPWVSLKGIATLREPTRHDWGRSSGFPGQWRVLSPGGVTGGSFGRLGAERTGAREIAAVASPRGREMRIGTHRRRRMLFLSLSSIARAAPFAMSSCISALALPLRHTSSRPVMPRATSARHASKIGLRRPSARTSSAYTTR